MRLPLACMCCVGLAFAWLRAQLHKLD